MAQRSLNIPTHVFQPAPIPGGRMPPSTAVGTTAATSFQTGSKELKTTDEHEWTRILESGVHSIVRESTGFPWLFGIRVHRCPSVVKLLLQGSVVKGSVLNGP